MLSGRRLLAHLPLNPQMVERITRGMIEPNQQQEYSQEINGLVTLAARANTPQAQRALRNALEHLPELLQTAGQLREMGIEEGAASLRDAFRRSINIQEPNEQIFNSANRFCQAVLANREMISLDTQTLEKKEKNCSLNKISFDRILAGCFSRRESPVRPTSARMENEPFIPRAMISTA
jgi:hypothetical protein